jgi:hypothetical protein
LEKVREENERDIQRELKKMSAMRPEKKEGSMK